MIERIIEREKPEGLLAGLGGQTALNMAVALDDAGVFKRHPIRLLGTPLSAIKMAEDRELFREMCDRIGQPTAPSAMVQGASDDERMKAERLLELVALEHNEASNAGILASVIYFCNIGKHSRQFIRVSEVIAVALM